MPATFTPSYSAPHTLWPFSLGRYRRVALGVLLLLTTVGIMAWLGQWAAARERHYLTDTITRSLEIHTLALRSAAANFNYLPYTAARHPDVMAALSAPQDRALRERANRYLEDVNRRAGSVALYVMDIHGITQASSNWTAPQGQSFVGQDYANRPYFRDAARGQAGLFYGIGQTTGDSGLFMAAPVYQGAQLRGVVAVKVSLHAIESTWANVRDPILLADARGIFFMGSVPEWLYHATRTLSPDEVATLDADQQYGHQHDFPLVPWTAQRSPAQDAYWLQVALHGRTHRFLAMDATLPELGWTLTVMADEAPIAEALGLTWALGILAAGLIVVVGLYWRLHERRQAEQRTQALQRQHDKQLQHSARLASLGEMASTLAHELNQPLAALSNFASAAQAFAQQGQQALLIEILGDIQGQAQRSGEIVRRIRGLAQQQTQGIEPCSLNAIIDNILLLLQAEVRTHGARVVCELSADLPLVPGDRVLLGQVILNLVMNSLQAMQDTPEEARVVEIATRQAGAHVIVSVADRGLGISPDVASHLFEPFFTTKPDGLGLGMNICRSIIESHRGQLSFEHRPEGGTVFVIQLICAP